MLSNIVTFVSDPPLDKLRVGDVAKVTILLNGAPITGGDVRWAQPTIGALLRCEPLTGSTVPGQVQKFTAFREGAELIYCFYNGTFSQPQHVTVAAPLVLGAPALDWSLLRPDICVVHTDFNYNWDQPHDWTGTEPTPMEILYAKRYDVSYSGSPYRQARLKKVNPNIRCIPYAELLSTLTNANGAPNLATEYCNDFDAWNTAHGVSVTEAEKGWLHLPGFTDAAHRLTRHADTNSARFYPDPTNANMRAFNVDRMKRLCAPAYTDGVFLDEYGSGGNRADYALACTVNGVVDTVHLQALCDGQTSLLAAISAAMYPKQLVINTGGYLFTWDAQETKAARGAHMEQTNDPMSLDWWGSVWPYIDARLREQAFINMVTLREFGGYEYVRDAQSPVNAMDTGRGKELELAGYFMCVTDKPQLLGLSFENGAWNTAQPTKNWLPQIDHRLGHPLEARQQNVSPRYFTRRFATGLVIVNPVVDRLAPNYGAGNARVISLPTDRAYFRVGRDGSVATSRTLTVTLRTPEAAIFTCAP